MYDLIIIGAGLAGVSAALTAQARGLDFVLCGAGGLSPKIARAERIMNYPGLPAVTGGELRQRLLRQLEEADIPIRDLRIDAIVPMGGSYAVCAGKAVLEGSCLLLATGVSGTREIPGESRLMGRGVSCCATCDGALYSGKDIAVVCASRDMEDEVEFLAGLARRVELFAAYRDCAVRSENVVLHMGLPDAIEGDERAEAVLFAGKRIPVDGVFCLREYVSPAALLPGLSTENGHIQADRRQRASLPGCFAAGDCTGRPYQYMKAAGEGNVAVHSAIAYLRGKRTGKEGAV